VIAFEAHEFGTILNVRAKAGARTNGVLGTRGDRLLVSVTQAPEKGKANRAIAKVLAAWLDVSPADIELISGETSQQKRFLVRGVSREIVAARLSSLES
jgi:uncharacterized protein (TIGR00251 family)